MVKMALIGGLLYLAFCIAVTLATLQVPVHIWTQIAERIGGL